ncbi:MAG: hypothetical protein ABGX63_02540 [bacterium]
MIRSMVHLEQALKSKRFIGVVVYAGPSKIDGKPIVAIANGIIAKSQNGKTGQMVQTWILARDIAPHHAVKSGADVSVCGDCPLRPSLGGDSDCYVRTYQAPYQVWKSYHAGRYAVPGVDFDADLMPHIFAGLKLRFGAYGDPYAVPVKYWMPLKKYAANWTGYTHQWFKAPKALKTLCMASIDEPWQLATAHAMDWRTFRVKKKNETLTAWLEVGCPAAKENGQRTNCADCGLCKGNSIKAKNIVINDHGNKRHALA